MWEDWARLRQLRKEQQRIAKTFHNAYSEVDHKNSEAVNALFDVYGQQRLAVSLSIEQIKTNQLLVLAEKYDVPVPPIIFSGNTSPDWFRSPLNNNTLILNELARAELRAAIRAERKERWEQWYRWVPLITGLLGTAIGLVAIMKK